MSDDRGHIVRCMARTEPQVNIRMPAELKAWLEERAAAHGRSFTAEVVSRLRGQLEHEIDADEYLVRIPVDLRDRLIDAAESENCDPNDLVVQALERAYPPPAPTLGALVEMLQTALARGGISEDREADVRTYLDGAQLLLKAKPYLAKRRISASALAGATPHPWNEK